MHTAMIYFSGSLPQSAFDTLIEDLVEMCPGEHEGNYYIDLDEPSTTAPARISEIASRHQVEMIWVCPVGPAGEAMMDGICHLQVQDRDGKQGHYDGYGESILVCLDKLEAESYIADLETARAHQRFIKQFVPSLQIDRDQAA